MSNASVSKGSDDLRESPDYPIQHQHPVGRRSSTLPEEAPLLQDGNPAEARDDGVFQNTGSLEKSAGERVQNAGRWLWKNMLVVCIVILLIGGLVALAVYFSGRYRQLFLQCAHCLSAQYSTMEKIRNQRPHPLQFA